MSLLPFLLAAAAPAEPAAVELLPSGKWQVEYAKSSCVISRAFGEKPNQLLFGLKPAPYSDSVAMLIVQPSPKGRGVGGKATIELSGGLVPDHTNYASVTANGMRVTTINLPRVALDSLAKGESISIKADNWVNVALKPKTFDRALKALEDCESDLLTSWGFDKAAQAAVAKRPVGQIFGLIQPDDYPTEALEWGMGGTVGVRMRIEPDGTISECIVLESSGVPVLDKTTCAILKKRGQFTPAQGHDGKPIPAPYFAWISWQTEARAH
jgi:TonB family protein